MEGMASIVVGLDFSECSRVALGHAQRLASWAGAQVHPVHIVDTLIDEILDDATLTPMQRGIHAGLVEDARKKWNAFIKGTPEASRLDLDVAVSHRLVGIRQQLDRHNADLLGPWRPWRREAKRGHGNVRFGLRSQPPDRRADRAGQLP